MATFSFSKAFRRLNIFRKECFSANFSTHKSELPLKIQPILVQVEKPTIKLFDNHVAFTARSINLNFDITRNRLPINKIIECPILPNFQIDEPLKIKINKNDIVPNTVIETPGINIIEKQAHRMLVIRRKKMKKHKRRKFLKKMKYVILKKEVNKKVAQEKKFQNELQEMHKKAEMFDPKEYVKEQLYLLTRKRLPNKWEGEKLPESMIKQFIKEKEAKEAHRLRLRTYRLKLD